MSAYDPKRTSFGLALLGERRSYLIGKSLSRIVKTWRVPSSRHCPFEQNATEALALRGQDWWTTALLPLKEEGGLWASGIE